MRFYKRIISAIMFMLPAIASAQDFTVKTNLFYGAYTSTPNLAVEIGLGERATLDVGAGYNPWNLAGSEENNDKIVHLLGTAEYRYWLCEKFNGHFFGAHLVGASYNIGGHELPLLFGKGSAEYRHQGWALGAGVSYGYQFVLGEHWNLEFSIGVGYVRFAYDRYECEKCMALTDSPQRNYFGPTRGGISLMYLF